jgi:hypothetical protein
MSIPNRQIGWSQESNLLWQISKQLDQASCQLCTISGTSGTSGTSGYDGDRFRTTSTTTFTLGVSTTIVVEPGLAYTPAQDIIITYNVGNHQTCTVVSYDINTGVMVIGPPVTVTGSGTYSSWTVNLDGAAGGDGSSGTSGTSGSTGTSGSSGTSPVLPLPVVYGLYSQTANSVIVTNTTTESTLIGTGVGTLTVPANGFSVGDSFRAIFGGVMNAGNNETIRIKLKSGSVILLDSGLQNLGSAIIDDVWSLNVDFTIRQIGTAGVASIVSLGSFHYTKTNNASIQGFGFNVVNNTTFNTIISNTLDVTVQWGSASTGNNIYSDIFILNKTY